VARFLGLLLLGENQSLGKVLLDVLDVLDTHRDTDVVLINSGSLLLLQGKLLMGGGGWVNDQGPDISNVGKVRGELNAVNELDARGPSSLDAESEHTAKAVLEILLGVLVIRVRLKSRVGDIRNLRALGKPLGEGHSVGSVLESERKKKKKKEEEEGRRRGRRTNGSQSSTQGWKEEER
jgi:hypothetical protein